ncbi:hypothetical protein [Nostoc sp.]|uniref:hypothetical protein n=1 Tax=Nostoc sp. TaxID=1180 RepID=UPI002FF98A33
MDKPYTVRLLAVHTHAFTSVDTHLPVDTPLPLIKKATPYIEWLIGNRGFSSG